MYIQMWISRVETRKEGLLKEIREELEREKGEGI
jgi:hypothetical protein